MSDMNLASEREVWEATLAVLKRDRQELDEMIAWLTRRLAEVELSLAAAYVIPAGTEPSYV